MPLSVEIRERELSFLEILREGIGLFQSHLGSFLQVTIATIFPIYAALFLLDLIYADQIQDVLAQAKALGELSQSADEEAVFGAMEDFLVDFLKVFSPIFLIASGLFMVLGNLAFGAVCFLTERAIGGETLDWIQAMKRSLDRLWPMIWTNILWSSVIVLGFFCCCFPGIWLSFVFLFSPYTAALRDCNGGNALNYASRLFKKDRLKVIFYSLGIFLLFGLISTLFNWIFKGLAEGTPFIIVVNVIRFVIIYIGVIAETLLFLNLDYLAPHPVDA